MNKQEIAYDAGGSEIRDAVIEIDRISRTVAGGRRLRFRALVVVGNGKGKVGVGLAKAAETTNAIEKAKTWAKKRMIEIPLHGNTISGATSATFAGTKVILKPAPDGTSIIAGGAIRAIMDLGGVKNVVGKIIGSTNKINTIEATLLALKILKTKAEHSKALKKVV